MKILKFACFLCFCLILCTCNNLDCCSDGPPRIDLSKDELSFNMQEGIDSAFVRYNAYWWFGEESGLQNECEYIKPANEPNYCNDNYCNDNKGLVMKIECPWFSAVRTNDSTILVLVKQNGTETKRSKNIPVYGILPYSTSVLKRELSVTQCPEPIELSKEELSFSAEGGIDSIAIAMNRDIDLTYKIALYGWPGSIVAQCHYDDSFVECPSWFTLDISDKNKIIVSVSKNDMALGERTFGISFEDRCEKTIIVTQSAE